MGYSLLTDLEKEIINSLAEYDMNVALAAKETHFHRNNYLYHMEKIQKKTALNPKKFFDLIKLKAMAEGRQFYISDAIKKYVERVRCGQYGKNFENQQFVSINVEDFYTLLKKIKEIEVKEKG